jgi:ferritin-like metal-binding protein YciE
MRLSRKVKLHAHRCARVGLWVQCRQQLRSDYRRYDMIIENPYELFVLLLGNVRQGIGCTTQTFQEFSKVTQNADVKEALEARVFLSQQVVEQLDECFKLIGDNPVKLSDRLQEIFVENFRKELADIKSPIARELYVLAKVSQWIHLHIGEYEALIAAAEMTGHYGVGVLLESCLAEQIVFAERMRRLIVNIIEGKVAATLAA